MAEQLLHQGQHRHHQQRVCIGGADSDAADAVGPAVAGCQHVSTIRSRHHQETRPEETRKCKILTILIIIIFNQEEPRPKQDQMLLW